jgi:REP element-mobilizing transposase RayT
MTGEFKRKNIRLPAANYLGRRSYFVTLCFEGRRRFGAKPGVAPWLIARLREHAATCGFFVHAYCVMPDHLHALAAAAVDKSNLMKFIESFKQETAVAFERRTHRRLWQAKYYDRILRGSDSPERVAWYIWMNPVRQGLCRSPAMYPFLGSFTEVGARLLKGSPALEWTPPWKSRCRAKGPGATFQSFTSATDGAKTKKRQDAGLKAPALHLNLSEHN